jgi:hypothetical protein
VIWKRLQSFVYRGILWLTTAKQRDITKILYTRIML